MAYEDIERHLTELGAQPYGRVAADDEQVWIQVRELTGTDIPGVVRWMITRFGGCHFPEGALYFDPHYEMEVLFAGFLEGKELISAIEHISEAVPIAAIPFSDSDGNYLAVGIGPENDGVVYYWVHDAFLDENLHVVSNSIVQFLLNLHRESPEHQLP